MKTSVSSQATNPLDNLVYPMKCETTIKADILQQQTKSYLERSRWPNLLMLPSLAARESTYPKLLLARKKSYMTRSPKLLQTPLQN